MEVVLVDKQEFQERKDKILNKIFITPEQVTRRLRNDMNFLTRQNYLLNSNNKKKISEILEEIEIIMQKHELEFRESRGDIVSSETIKYSLELREKIKKDLPEALNPSLRKLIKSRVNKVSKAKREYRLMVKEEENTILKLKQLKKDKKIELKDMRKKLRQIIK